VTGAARDGWRAGPTRQRGVRATRLPPVSISNGTRPPVDDAADLGPAGPDDEGTHGSRFSLGRVAAMATITALLVFWLYIWLLAPTTKPDQLHDRDYVARVIPICQATKDRINALPPANTAKTAIERADTLDVANGYVRDLAASLRAQWRGADDHDNNLMNLWLTDWDQYARDRQAYADALRLDQNAKFDLTARDSGPISEAIDSFARINKMKECVTPLDA